MKKVLLSLLVMMTSIIAAQAQNSGAAATQDADSLYAKALLPVGTEAPAFPALKKGTWTVLDF